MEEGVDPKFLETQRRLQEEARERNRSEFGEEGEAARLRLEGFRAGLYVRLVLKSVPVEFIKVRPTFQSMVPSCIHTCCSPCRQQPDLTCLASPCLRLLIQTLKGFLPTRDIYSRVDVCSCMRLSVCPSVSSFLSYHCTELQASTACCNRRSSGGRKRPGVRAGAHQETSMAQEGPEEQQPHHILGE